MATTTTPTDLQEIKYRQQYWQEYVRQSGFLPYMGNGPMTTIHTAFELTTSGKSLTIPLVSRLKSSGVTGNTRLSGAEEALGKHTHSVTVAFARNAVELSKQDEHYDASSARDAVRPLLKEWSATQLRDRTIDALCSVTFSGTANSTFTVPLVSSVNASSSAGQNNTWVAANIDRVQFGALASNYSATFATALANVDSTNDKLTAAAVSVMKRKAMAADPHIRPIRTEDGREYFVLFAGLNPFRDLKNDSQIIANMRDARAREGNAMNDNPLFQDGDLMHDGVIVRQIPEIPSILAAGAGSINVGPVFLCGAQAVCVGWGQQPAFTQKKEDDYGFFSGIGIEEMIGVNKIMRKHGVAGTYIDNGIVTGFFSDVADA
jgi:hypothetical protein